MSDDNTGTGSDSGTQDGQTDSTDSTDTGRTGGNSTDDLSSLKATLDKERNLRREAEKRAKEAAAYKKQLDDLSAAQMTEQEKAVKKAADEAEARGRSAALKASAERLARAEFRAAAAGRIDNIDDLLEDLNLAKFVGEDGEPDDKAIKARVEKWAPKRTANFDGGARTSADKTTDMNALIRQKAGFSA